MVNPVSCSLAILVIVPTFAVAEEAILATQVGAVKVEIFIPQQVKVLRGVFVHADGSKLKADDAWAELCRELQFAHLALDLPDVAKAKKSHERLSKALVKSLAEFAGKSSHRELVRLPLAGAGHSAGGQVSGVLLRMPERMLALSLDCNGVLDPDRLPDEAAGVPALFTMGAVPDAFEMLPSIEKFYLPARRKGLPWSIGVQWGCAQDYGNTSALSLPWLRAAIRARLPEGHTPADGAVRLRSVRQEDGWLGDRTTIQGHFPSVAAYGSYEADKSTAAWFPSREAAYVWRAWQSKDAPLTIEAETAEGEVKLPHWEPKVARSLFVEQGADIALSVKARQDIAVERVRFYDGDRMLAEVVGRGQAYGWRAPAPGIHAVWAQWEGSDGKLGVTNPALVILRVTSR